ncbi:MAG: autotransporter outer membrane beta-barrel domain-containing protein [Planctomycetia bacterium]|nr:autotransporter outer membrane beta-barrel domain-containing protein [Planctomycetia bacterium]
MKGFRFICVLSVLLTVGGRHASAQFLYATAGKANLQTSTLENIMLLQNVRDVDYSCPDCQTWFTGYGFGGFADGISTGSAEAAEVIDPVTENKSDLTIYDSHYTQATGGFLLGGDKNFSDSCRAGLFFAYNNNVQESVAITPFLQTTQRINMHNYFWGGYGRKDFRRCYLMGTLAGGYSRLGETVRYQPDDLIPDNNAKTGSWRALTYGEIGTEIRIGRSLFQPFWGIQYFYNGYDNAVFTVEGSTLTEFAPLKTNSLRNILGIRYARDLLHTTQGFLKFDCLGFWYHEYLSNEDMGIAKIQANEAQQATAVYSGRDWAVIAPTLTYRNNNWRIWAGYIVMFNEYETINLGQGGIALCF